MFLDLNTEESDIQIIPRPNKLKSEFHGRSEAEVWDQFRSGNETAFIHIYDQYFKILFRYGSQFTRDKNTIKDAIQDVFIELLQKRNRLSATTSVKFYLFKSLKRALINLAKKNQKCEYQEQYDGFEFLITRSVEHVIINRQLDEEKLNRITTSMEKLTKKQREILYYFYFENLSMQEISSLMNFSNIKSAQNLFYRALQMLKMNIFIIVVLLKFF